jgi:hypothetical protein
LVAVDSGTAPHVKTRVIVPFIFGVTHGVVNPLDSLTDSDIKIIEAATDLTEKDGKMYNSIGKETYTPEFNAVTDAIFTIRNFGVPDAHSSNVLQVQGDITADDISKYVDFYAAHGRTAISASTIKNIMEYINSNKANNPHSPSSILNNILNA